MWTGAENLAHAGFDLRTVQLYRLRYPSPYADEEDSVLLKA
jgi:hypothetical protein